MTVLGQVLYIALLVFLLLLLARWVLEMVMTFARSWRPTGVVAMLFEVVYTVTDPPVKLLRRLIPPLRVGSSGFALDLSFIVLVVGIGLLMGVVQQL